MISKEEQQRIEDRFIELAKTNFFKVGSVKYKDAQVAYFQGAMTALNEVPVLWGICMMSGRDIIQERKTVKI